MREVAPAWKVAWPFDHDRPVWAAGEILLPEVGAFRLVGHGAGAGAVIWYAPVEPVELRPTEGPALVLDPGCWCLAPGPQAQLLRVRRPGVRVGFLWSPGLERLLGGEHPRGRPLSEAALALCDRLHQCLYCPVPGRFGCWRLSVRLLELILAVEGGDLSEAESPVEPVDRAVAAALRLVEGADGDYPTAQELAERVGLSHSQFARRFHACMGMNFRAFLTRYRLNRARALLEGGEGNVTEAAFAAGYGNVSQFSRAFRRHFGRSPREVCERLRN
jgi:AraC-like DNA-binding protein